MCVALNQISELNIVLKDIKPENMMIVSSFEREYNTTKQMMLYPDIIPDDGMPDKLRVVLIDFGLAKQFVCNKQVCEFAGTPTMVCIRWRCIDYCNCS